MKKWYVIILALLFVASTTILFAAAPDPGSTSSGSPASFQKPRGFGSYLNLSQEQRDKMRELRSRYYADIRDLRYDLLQKRLEMRKLFTDPKTDDATLLAKQNELNSLRQKLMVKKAQMKIEWRKVLTPEQIQKLDRMPNHQQYYGH
jgi:Spy/CpxP family protein refolding chaperone